MKKRLPHHPPNRDFFVADILDCSSKGDRHSMEHPMFALSKKKDLKIRRYEHNGNSLTITPSVLGLANMWDKDILIYAISQMVEGINRGRDDAPNRVVHITAYDLLVATSKGGAGKDKGKNNYTLLKAAFERLSGTRITTDITTNGVRIQEGFGLIDSWRIVEKTPDGRMVAIRIVLSEWLYNAVQGMEVLTLSPDYFGLGPLEKRLYELARKHCGHQAKWIIGIDLLHKKSGASSPLKGFRFDVKKIVEVDSLPEYHLQYEADSDQIIFRTRDPQKLIASLLKE